MAQDFPIVIFGGTNLIAPYVMQRVKAAGLIADVIARNAISVPQGFTLTHMDLGRARNWIAPENAIVISLLPLWVLDQFLPRFIGVRAIIAGRAACRPSSAAEGEARTEALRLERAETMFHDWCLRSNVTYTLLRTTMIYDGLRDKNIARMARFIKRFGFLPLARPARGLRQPVHADDLAKAIFACVNNDAAMNKDFNIAGGEILTYRAMAERLFAMLGKKPRFLMLPADWLQKGFGFLARMGLASSDSLEAMLSRQVNEDLVFDTAEGLNALDYQPRRFEPGAGS